MLQNNSPNSPKKIVCDLCDYKCCKKSDMEKHFSSLKHQCNKNDNLGNTEIRHIELVCKICDKTYKSRVGMWRHKKICTPSTDYNIIENSNKISDVSSSEINVLTNLVLEMVKSNTELQKQNNELQKQVLEVCKNNNTTNNNTNHINSHNKTFNLQFFLNEQCKDAMNISDFVNTFDLQLEDLESVGELGYVEGITKQIVNKLNSMDIYKRPMHCSDAKRETIYIKDDNKWEKEEKNNPKLRQAIKNLSFINMKLVGKWSDTYPESKSSESRLNDKYMKLIKQTTGGNGEISDSEDKIIRRIAKEIIIDKI